MRPHTRKQRSDPREYAGSCATVRLSRLEATIRQRPARLPRQNLSIYLLKCFSNDSIAERCLMAIFLSEFSLLRVARAVRPQQRRRRTPRWPCPEDRPALYSDIRTPYFLFHIRSERTLRAIGGSSRTPTMLPSLVRESPQNIETGRSWKHDQVLKVRSAFLISSQAPIP